MVMSITCFNAYYYPFLLLLDIVKEHFFVELTGIEPVASALQGRRSPS